MDSLVGDIFDGFNGALNRFIKLVELQDEVASRFLLVPDQLYISNIHHISKTEPHIRIRFGIFTDVRALFDVLQPPRVALFAHMGVDDVIELHRTPFSDFDWLRMGEVEGYHLVVVKILKKTEQLLVLMEKQYYKPNINSRLHQMGSHHTLDTLDVLVLKDQIRLIWLQKN